MRDKMLVSSSESEAPSRAMFATAAETHRRALKLHCYRMLGSLHEAEDAVQETMLRAWRGFDDFEARAADDSGVPGQRFRAVPGQTPLTVIDCRAP